MKSFISRDVYNEMMGFFIYDDKEFIKTINSISEEQQMVLIKTDPILYEHIKKPSKKLQMAHKIMVNM